MATQFGPLGGLLGGWAPSPEEVEAERQRQLAIQQAAQQAELLRQQELAAQQAALAAQQAPAEPQPSAALDTGLLSFLDETRALEAERPPLSSRMEDVATTINRASDPAPAKKPTVTLVEDDDYRIEMDDDGPAQPVVVANMDGYEISLEDILSAPIEMPTQRDRGQNTRAAMGYARAASAANKQVAAFEKAGEEMLKRVPEKERIFISNPEEKQFAKIMMAFANTPNFNTEKMPTAREIVEFGNRISEEQFGGRYTNGWNSLEEMQASLDQRDKALADPRYKGANARLVRPVQVQVGRTLDQFKEGDELPNEPRMWQRGFGLAPSPNQEIEDARNADGSINVNKANRPDVGATDIDNLITQLQASPEMVKGGILQAMPYIRRELVRAAGVATGGGVMGEAINTGLNAVLDDVASDLEQNIRDAGRNMADKGKQIYDQADPGYEPGTAKFYAYNTMRSLVELAEGVAASAATGSPTVGAAIIATRVFGQTFDEDIRAGIPEDMAGRHATFMALAELLPERTVIGSLLDNAATKFSLKKMVKGGLGEAAQEDITETLSIGWDLGVFKKDMSLNQIADRLKDATVMGFGAGSGVAGALNGKYTNEERIALEEFGNRLREQMAKQREAGQQTQQQATPPAQEDIEIVEARPITGMRTGPVKTVRPTKQPVDREGVAQTFRPPDGTVTSRVGPRKSFRTENGQMASSNHKGTDYGGMKLGAPVLAGADGVVLRVDPAAGGYGKRVILGFSDGTTASYSHNSAITVTKGQEVKQGDVIAKAGKSGNATGVHVHLELRDRKGRILDPATGKPITVTVKGSQRVPVVKDDTAYDVVYEEPGKELEPDYDPVAIEQEWEGLTGTRFEPEEDTDTPSVATETPRAADPVTPAVQPPTMEVERRDDRPRASLGGPLEAQGDEVAIYRQDENGQDTDEVVLFINPVTNERRFVSEADYLAEGYGQQEAATPATEPLISERLATQSQGTEAPARSVYEYTDERGRDGVLEVRPRQGGGVEVVTGTVAQAYPTEEAALEAIRGRGWDVAPFQGSEEDVAPAIRQSARGQFARTQQTSQGTEALGAAEATSPLMDPPPSSPIEPQPELELRESQIFGPPETQEAPRLGPVQGPPQDTLQLRDDQRADRIFRDPFPATGGLELTNEERDRSDLASGNQTIGALDNLGSIVANTEPNEEGRVPLVTGVRGEAVAALRDMGVDVRQSDLTISGADAALLQEEGVEGLAQRYKPREEADTLELNLTVAQARDILTDAMRSVQGGNADVVAGFEAGARRALGFGQETMTPEIANQIANNRRFRAGFDKGETVAANLAENNSRGGTSRPTAPAMAGPTATTATAAPAMRPAETGQVAGATDVPTSEAPATTTTETVTPDVAPSVEPDGSLGPTGQNTGGWVVRDKETGEAVLETTQRSVAEKVNTEKYEVVTTLEHLQSLNEPETKAATREELLDRSTNPDLPMAERQQATTDLIALSRREAIAATPTQEAAPDPRIAILASLPKPAENAAPAVAAARLRGQEAGMGLTPPTNLSSKSKAFKTAYNLGVKEGKTALKAMADVEAIVANAIPANPPPPSGPITDKNDRTREAYAQGYRDRANNPGSTLPVTPFPANSDDEMAWRAGFAEANKALAEKRNPAPAAETVSSDDTGVVASAEGAAVAPTPAVSQEFQPRPSVVRDVLLDLAAKVGRMSEQMGSFLTGRGYVRADERGGYSLTDTGRASVSSLQAAIKRADAIDDRLGDLNADDNKRGAIAFARKLMKEGVIPADTQEYDILAKDKDMEVDDVTSAIQGDVEAWLDRQTEAAVGGETAASRGGRQPYDPDRRAKLDALLRDKGPEILAKIDAEIRKMGLVGRADLPTIELVGRFSNGEQGTYNYATLAIKISALDAINPAGVTRHEVIHWARDRGVFNETEWNILAKWASGQKGLMKWARTNYDGPNVPDDKRLTEDELIEEAVAEGFNRVMRGEEEIKATPIIQRLVEKMGAVVAKAREFFDRSGVLKADREAAMELFESLYSGQQIGIAEERGSIRDINDRSRRAPAASRTAPIGARLGDAPVPNPSIFRRVSQSALFGLTKMGAIRSGKFNTVKKDTTDTLGAAIDRKLHQKYRQAFSTQTQVEDFLGYPMPEEADLRGGLVADERGYKLAWMRDRLVIPMGKEIQERGVDMTDLGMYLYARHAEARNIRVAAENKEFNLTDKPGSGMRTDDARRILADFAASGKDTDLAAIAGYVDRILDFARQEKIDARLLTPTDIANGFQPGDFFVPLRGHDTEPEHEYNFGAHTGKSGGFSTQGKESPTMYGRSSMADPTEIIGNVIALASQSVVRSYEAKVGQKALKMFQLAKLNGLYEPRFVQIDPVTRRAVWVKDNSPQGGHVEYQMQTRIDENQDPFTLYVKQDGQEYRLLFDQSNPSAVRMVKALKNLDPAKFGVLMRWSGLFVAWTRFSNTQASPVFMLTNPVRDVQTGLVNASSLKIPGLRRAMLGNLIKGGPLIGAFRNARRGKGDKSAVTGLAADWVRLAEEADAAGGILNYGQALPMEEAIVDLQSVIKDAGRGKLNPFRMANATVRGIEVFTSATENMTRLAAYKALRDKGVPAKKAAQHVRELTTNFSQHGEWGPSLSMMYAFANANIVGNMRTAATYIARPSTFASLVSLGATTAVINGLFGEDEDDPDAKRYSEEELDKMIVLPTKGLIGRDLTPPIGYGINVPITFGRKVAEYFMGKRNEDGSKMTPMDVVSAMAHSVATAFNPISGQNALAMAAPSILDIPAAFVTNENFFGNPIYKEQYEMAEPTPASERMWKKTEDSVWASMAGALNDLTNGADDTGTIEGWADVSPDGAKYVADQLMGGLGRTIWRSIEMPLDNKDDVWTDHPLVKPFTREPGGSLTKEDRNFTNFRERMEALDDLRRTDDNLHLRGSKGIDEFNQENKAQLRMIDPDEGEKKSVFADAKSLDKQLTDGMSALRKARGYVEGFKDTRQRNSVAKAAGIPKSELPMGQPLTPARFKELRAMIEERQGWLAEDFNKEYRTRVLEGED